MKTNIKPKPVNSLSITSIASFNQREINLSNDDCILNDNDDYILETLTRNKAITKFNQLGYTVTMIKEGYVVKNYNKSSYPVFIESDQELERYLIECFLLA